MIRDILLNNAKEYLDYAKKALAENKNNVAMTLLFKALAALADICILRDVGVTPSNHKERFRLLELHSPQIYNIIDKDFP